MIVIPTERLELRSNCRVVNGKFTYSEAVGEIDILHLPKSTYGADSGFAVYLKSGELIGHIDVLFRGQDRPPYELSIGIFDEYQRHGYMTEAMKVCVDWIFDNCQTEKISGILGGITDQAAQKILERCGFRQVPHEKWNLWEKHRDGESER